MVDSGGVWVRKSSPCQPDPADRVTHRHRCGGRTHPAPRRPSGGAGRARGPATGCGVHSSWTTAANSRRPRMVNGERHR